MEEVTISRVALQILAAHPEGEYAQKIAESMKEPYKSVHKALMRLTKKKVVKHPERGFFMLNHDEPVLVSTYLKSDDLGCGGVCLHGVGLGFDVPRLHRCLLVTEGFEWKRNHWRGRSVVFGGDVRLFRGSAYFQWKGAPFPFGDLILFLEDGLKTLAKVTNGLAEVKGVWLNDYEEGPDVPFDMLLLKHMKVKKIVTYPKNGYMRKHIQFNKKRIPLPLDQDAKITMLTDFYTTMTEEEDLIEHIFRTQLSHNHNNQTTMNPSLK